MESLSFENTVQTTARAHKLRLTEVFVASIVLFNMLIGYLERSILETLAYSDIFEYPLRLRELHRYLPIRAKIEQLPFALESLSEQVGMKDDFYFLAGREEIVETRKRREKCSQKLLLHALKYGRVLGALPFARMVALTGSLAVTNSSKNADFDYMLVTVPGRVWTARAFALLFNRIARLSGHTLCPNLIVAENNLAWSTHDLYSAHELCQMVPITGMDVYQKLMKANQWIKDFLPNSVHGFSREQNATQVTATIKHLLELPLWGKPGDRLERWIMNRKIAQFQKQEGFGKETVFTADICQGNFNHHGQLTRDLFEERLMALAAVPGSKSPSPRTAMGAFQ